MNQPTFLVFASVVTALCVIAVLYMTITSRRQAKLASVGEVGQVRVATPQETQAIDDALGLVSVAVRLHKEDHRAICGLSAIDQLAHSAKVRQLILRSLLAELEKKEFGIPIGLRRRLAELDKAEQEQRDALRTRIAGPQCDFDGDALNVADCIPDSDSTMRRMDPRLLWEHKHAPYYDSEGNLLRKGSVAFDAYIKDLREREAKHIEGLRIAEDNLQDHASETVPKT